MREREDSDCVVVHHSPELGTSATSEERVCGQRRRKFARPDFLLTQAPPTSPPTSSVPSCTTGSSDEEDFLEPLSRRLRKRLGSGGARGRQREKDPRAPAGKRVCLDSEELLDREAELSGEGGESGEEVVEVGEEDEYDMEDSFINDNSVLTQQVTPSQVPRRQTRRSPVNMADVYRRSLMSPDTLFAGRGKGRGNGYKMVLSQRHQILHHCLAKAGGRRLFRGEREGRRNCESGESEAEEVRVCYGEEYREEIEDSQSIGEPWDWGEEGEEAIEVERRSRDEEEIVSPSLLVSVEPRPTPSCYHLEVEGWPSDEESCCSEECPTFAEELF